MDPSLGMQQGARGWKVGGHGPKSYDKKFGKMWKTTGNKKGRWLWAQVLRQLEVGKNMCLQ